MAAEVQYRERLYKNYNQTWGKFASLEEVRRYLAAQRPQLEAELLPLMPADRKARIVDLGCGYGSFINVLKHHGYTNISGLDISPDQVRVANELGFSEVRQGNAVDFLSAAGHGNYFDAICAIDIIEHFTKDELLRFIEQVHAALKPGAWAVMRTPNVDAPFGTAYAFGDFTHECVLNKFSALELFQSMGFAQVEVLPGTVITPNPAPVEALRKILWAGVRLAARLTMFAAGISAKNVVLTPNIVIRAQKQPSVV